MEHQNTWKNIYLIADTHGKDIVLPLNCKTLVHLGDYEKGKISGDAIKILVKGNHDLSQNEVFDFETDALLLDNIYFTHEPQERLPKGGHYNICGHIHDNDPLDYGFVIKKFHIVLPANKLINLAELMNENIKH